jgi:hypothetical protein
MKLAASITRLCRQTCRRSCVTSRHLGHLCTLLLWQEEDVVDDAERRRNDVIFAWQGNRNPVVDHPEWVQSGANEHRSPERLRSYIVDTYDKDAGPNNQRLYLNGARVAQMSDTLPIDLNSAALGIGRHVSGIADPFNGHIDEFRISHVQHSDGWIETTWNSMSDPGAFAAAKAEEQEGLDREPLPLAGAGVVVYLMA